ncbi:SDR family NAD(P)-dependent oxidoreductase [Bacillus benzoevorans]|uniref:NAD(P)-dependent dehydrogenase (Short-subunit alcohol dehydrogenase family) n=1 Tax=Bacillus benzoevorans TaxID=1456 RepID=A0A7X0HTX4_9BACI|nr:SDR family NAD(P)-dependent oxidoreductase [Bacillus benzoevorans]MBB6446805.1 NAD(P)-dependent dehydrogenase (short-subunit alcohol dehydrogenase family) [Bacillus benzoevorans]
MAKLDGKVAIVTGGAGGLGKETAKVFLQEGAKVLIVDLSEEALLKTKEELHQYGEIITVKADVSQESDTINYVKTAVEYWGKIDVFFNNAGIEGKFSSFVETTVENFDQVMSVNVRGVFLGIKHVLPVMMAQKSGSIINTSSVAGLMGWYGITPYVASKHAVIGLTKNAALEAASSNVRVNSIHPAPVNTRMLRSVESGLMPGQAEAAKEAITNEIPIGRYGEPIDVAKLVLFLASDDSTFITGSQYRVDGGIGAK